MPDTQKEKGHYARYQELGGIINKKDCESALVRSMETITVNDMAMGKVEDIAKFAGIELHNTKDAIDPRVKLYAVLRSDIKSKKEAEYHHSDMSDQRLFAEALRMLGDAESLERLIHAYPNIDFE